MKMEILFNNFEICKIVVQAHKVLMVIYNLIL